MALLDFKDDPNLTLIDNSEAPVDFSKDPNLTPVENDVALDPNLTLIVEPNILQKNQAALNNAVDLNSSNPEVAPLREEADKQYNQMMQLAQMRFPEETIKSWENNPIGFKESFSFLDWEDVTPVAGGVAKGANYLKLANISKNIEDGKPVNRKDSAFLNEFIDKQVEMKIRGMNYGGKIVYYGAPLPAFMVEFGLTSGVGKAAQASTLKVIGEAVEKSAVKAVAAKTTGRVARVAAQSAAMVPMLASKYGERRAGAWNVTDKGEVIFAGADESPAKSALMAYAHVSAEVASELSGATLNKYLINPVTKRLATPLISGINKLPEKLKLALYDNYKRLKGNARVSRVFTAGGWNGMLAELGEERIADILRETTNLTLEEGYTFDEVLDGITPSKDDLLLEAGLISIVGGAKTSGSVVMNFLTSDGLSFEQAQEVLDNLTVQEQENIIDYTLVVETYDPNSLVMPEDIDLEIEEQVILEEAVDDSLDQIANANVVAELPDTRGQGQQYHGTSSEIINLAEYTYSPVNIYGQGFYTTDAADVSEGYSKKGKGKSPFIYKVNVVNDPVLYDLDSPISMNDRASVEDILDDLYPLYENEMGEFVHLNTLGEIFDTVRQESDQSADYIQESFEAVQELLRQDGYDGYTHVGGKFTKTNPHKVEIYWTPKNHIELEKIDVESRKSANIDILTQKEIDNYVENMDARVDELLPTDTVPLEEIASSSIVEELAPLKEGIRVRAGDRGNIGTVLSVDGDTVLVRFVNKEKGTEATKAFKADEVKSVTKIKRSKKVKFRAVAPEASIFNEFYYTWFDRLGALTDLAKEAKKRGKEQKVGENLALLVRMYNGVVDMATQMITNKTFIINADGNIVETGAGLQSILDDFDSMVIPHETNRKQRLKDFEDYLIAKRYLEDLVGKEDVTVTDQQKADSMATLTSLAEKYGETMRVFDTFAQEIYNYQQRILQMMVAGGNMSQKTYDNIIAENPNYIPFQRVMDKEFGLPSKRQLFSNASLNKVIKKIVGSELEIKSPIQQILSNTYRIADLAWQNRIATSIASMAEVMPEYVEKLDIPTIPVKDKDGNQLKNKDGSPAFRAVDNFDPKGAITVFVKGKKQFYKVDPSIEKGIQQMRPVEFDFFTNLLIKSLSFPATVLRAGATMVPEFWLKNVIRDMWSSFIMSPDKPTPIDTMKGLAAITGKTELYNQWMQSGGSFNSYMELDDNGLAKAQKELLNPKGRLAKYLSAPWKIPSEASLALEQSVRIGVYASAKKAGKSDLEAGFEARDATLDFARGGSASKFINRFIPFFNAGMQGSDKLYRAFRDNPKSTAMWALATITMPSLLITSYYLYLAPEEEKQEYLNIPQWQKDMFWVFKLGDQWARLPKPFSLGYIFGSVPERFLTWADSEGLPDGKNFAYELIGGTLQSVSPVASTTFFMPPPIKVAIETATNHNFYQDRDIFPSWMEDQKAPAKRFTKGTSETAKALGEQFDMSPALIDNALRGTFATGAVYMTDAGDYILNSIKEWNGEEIPEDPTSVMDIPLLRAFMVRDPTGNVSETVRVFYELHDEAKQYKDSLDDLKGAEKTAYKNENMVMRKSYNTIKRSGKSIAKLNKRRNKIYESVSMDGDTKRDRLKILDDKILYHGKRATDKVNKELEQDKK